MIPYTETAEGSILKNMDIKSILQDDKKKRKIVIGLVLFLIILGLLFVFTRTPSAPQTNNDQLLSDIAKLAPRNSASQSENRMVAPIITMSADAKTVAPGQPAVISWTSNNATSCTDGNGNSVNATGTLSIAPRDNYTLDIVCTNTKGTTLESITVAVTTAPFITLSAYPAAVRVGDQSLISWNTINTTRCTDSAGNTMRLNSGFFVAPRKAYTFEINCTGPNGADKKSVTVTIDNSKPPAIATVITPLRTSTYQPPAVTTPVQTTVPKTTPQQTTSAGSGTITISASKTTVAYGEPSVISWRTTNAKNCKGTTNTGVELLNSSTGQTGIILMPLYSPFPGPVPLPDNGSMAIRVLDGHRIATLIVRCDNPDGTQTERSITVTSNPLSPDACINKRPCVNIDPNMTSLTIAQGSTLDVRWTSACATSCTIRSTGGGSAITYPTPDYLAQLPVLDSSVDYNKYVSIPASIIGVEKSGGVRVGAGAITLSCTNYNATTPLTMVKSMTIAYPPPPDDGGWGFGGLIAVVVFAVATFYSAGMLSVVASGVSGSIGAATAVVTATDVAVGVGAGMAAGSLTGGATPASLSGAANPNSWGSSMGCSNSVSSAVTPNNDLMSGASGAGNFLQPDTVIGWAVLLVLIIVAFLVAYLIYKSYERRKKHVDKYPENKVAKIK